MSNISDFNKINDCNKIDPQCIDAFVDYKLDPNNSAGLCVNTSWGGTCLDLTSIVKAGETCTTMYLSPETDPNCLVYEPEEKCGDNVCIHGDDLSRIISMTKLKDVDQDTPPVAGDVYMYDGDKFVTFNLQEFVDNVNNTLTNIDNAIKQINQKLTPPEGAPENVRVVFGNINDYSDPEVEVDENTGTITALDKTHGLYSHSLNENKYADQVFG